MGRLRMGWILAVAVGLSFTACSRAPGVATLGDRAHCTAYGGIPTGWPEAAHAGMVRIAGGAFRLGSERGYAEERPLIETRIEPFWIDRTEVTNAQFAAFVQATGYVTEAERTASRADGGAAVFQPARERTAPGSWWTLVRGADWRHPGGSDTGIDGRGHEPVVDVTYADALAYARWLGRTLPDEAQWEFAAKAGRDDATADRALRDASGKPQANFWQGVFPVVDRGEDGFNGRAPVGCFKANPNGLHDMVGNVWEWTRDSWQPGHTAHALTPPEAVLPARQGGAQRVIKGGSYLCSADYCVRARASSRQGQDEDLPAVHIGFRTVSAD